MFFLKLLWEQHSFLYHVCNKQAYYIFQFHFSQIKMVNHYADFLDIQHLLQEYIPYYYFYYNFL